MRAIHPLGIKAISLAEALRKNFLITTREVLTIEISKLARKQAQVKPEHVNPSPAITILVVQTPPYPHEAVSPEEIQWPFRFSGAIGYRLYSLAILHGCSFFTKTLTDFCLRAPVMTIYRVPGSPPTWAETLVPVLI